MFVCRLRMIACVAILSLFNRQHLTHYNREAKRSEQQYWRVGVYVVLCYLVFTFKYACVWMCVSLRCECVCVSVSYPFVVSEFLLDWSVRMKIRLSEKSLSEKSLSSAMEHSLNWTKRVGKYLYQQWRNKNMQRRGEDWANRKEETTPNEEGRGCCSVERRSTKCDQIVLVGLPRVDSSSVSEDR